MRASSVSVIIFNEDRKKILLIQRRDIPVWVLPGGGIDPGEKPEDAAVREVLEESGYTARIVRKVAEYLPVNSMTRPTHFFECAIASGEKRINDEAQGIEFFPLDALPKLLPPPYPGWIRDAVEQHPKMLVKKIEGVSYWILAKLLLLHPILTGRYLLTKLGIHIND